MAFRAWNKKPCKYGVLKRPAKGGRGRVCRKAPRRARKGRNCKYGKLKHPTHGRVCRKRPGGGGGGDAFLPGNIWSSIFG